MKPKKKWYKQRTFWTMVLLAGTVVAPEFVAITPEQIGAIRTLLVAVGAIFMRDSVEGLKLEN